jgi:hypothetical protein
MAMESVITPSLSDEKIKIQIENGTKHLIK